MSDAGLGWHMDGGLPWRLAVLDDAEQIVLGRLRMAEMLAATLPKKSAERRAFARDIRAMHVTRECIWNARHLLAPPVSGNPRSRIRHYTTEQSAAIAESRRIARPWA